MDKPIFASSESRTQPSKKASTRDAGEVTPILSMEEFHQMAQVQLSIAKAAGATKLELSYRGVSINFLVPKHETSSAALASENTANSHSQGIQTLADMSLPLINSGLKAQQQMSPYLTHGDFCFGRVNDWYLTAAMHLKFEEELKDWDLIRAGIPLSLKGMFRIVPGELSKCEPSQAENFTRNGTFPYFKLPLDIRQNILRLLLGSFYSYDEVTKQGYISIDLFSDDTSLSNPRYPKYFEKDYESFVQSELVKMRNLGDSNLDLVIHDFDEDADFDDVKNDCDSDGNTTNTNIWGPTEFALRKHQVMRHPQRSCDYRLESLTYSKWGYISSDDYQSEYPSDFRQPFDHDWVLTRLVRAMSNVSIQFRKELSDVWWSNIQLNVCQIVQAKDDSHKVVRSFFADRPAVLKGIKSLNLYIHYFQDSADKDAVYGESFTAWCETVSKHLSLEIFAITIISPWTHLRHWVISPPKWLLAIKILPVTHDFKFYLLLDADDRVNPEEFIPLIDKYKAKFIRKLMPDSLRKVKEGRH